MKTKSASRKKYNEGGVVGNSNYPFGQGQMTSSASPSTPASTGLGNMAPLVQFSTANPEMVETQQPYAMKKGGTVKSKAKPKKFARGGGCEVRGKTKGRFV
jgi:hypothetical protein